MKFTLVTLIMMLSIVACDQAKPKNATLSNLVTGAPPEQTLTTTPPGTSSVQGGSDGGGSDTIHPWSESAWFVGKGKTVTACYVISSDFGVSEDEIANTIQSAYKIWDQYLAQKTGSANLMADVDLPTSVRILPTCQGSVDLTFYFGAKDSAVADASKNYIDPIAFAHRNSFVSKTWDSGFIWVADPVNARRLLGYDWTTSDLLLGILVHEIGHVLGNEHIPGTIMRADILDFLKAAAKKTAFTRHAMATSIDWTDDLIQCGFNFNFPGAFGADRRGPSELDYKYFKELMGRDHIGKISSRLWRKDEDFHLVISDESGSKDFVLNVNLGAIRVLRPGIPFKIFPTGIPSQFDPDYNPNKPTGYGSEVIINSGTIRTANGKRASFRLQRGGGSAGASWTVVYYPLTGGEMTVFAKLPGGIPFDSP